MTAMPVGRLDPVRDKPLYRQLQRLLRSAIDTRAFAPYQALPPERDLAAAYGISRVTVRKAIDGLVADRLLTRRRGSGTYVAARIEKDMSSVSSFSEDMLSRGRVPSSRWLSDVEDGATPDEALALGLAVGDRIRRCDRIRLADGAPMALEWAVVPAELIPPPNSVGRSLYAALGSHRPVRVLQRLRAVLFTEDQLTLLGIARITAGLEIERRGFDHEGRVVEVTRSLYRGDAYDYVTERGVRA